METDVIHIRYRSSEVDRRQRARQQPTPPVDGDTHNHTHGHPDSSTTSSLDGNGITTTTSTAANASHRCWEVTVTINEAEPQTVLLRDPFREDQYKSIFESYLQDSDRPRWSPESLERDETASFTATEDLIQAYGDTLLRRLALDVNALSPGATECHIYVIEQAHADEDAGIHCLAWELLEAVRIPQLPDLRLRVNRVSDFSKSIAGLGLAYGDRRVLPRTTARPLSWLQAETGATIRILLVIARDFSRVGANRDPEPDLAQWPLMTLQKKLRNRLLLEVVRPGSRTELEEHLKLRTGQGVHFNLVHFDMHGRIEHGRPSLLFAKEYDGTSSSRYQIPETRLASADSVARLLAAHQIENVVLNACLSAYQRSSPATNLAHIFLQHGIRKVSAMWFYVHWQTVSTYLDKFYDELLVKGVDFNVAAHRGREAIRLKPTSRTGQTYQDFFLCVNYSNEVPVSRATGLWRKPSPTPSVQSQDSSTSNTSGKSASKWKPSTPRLGDNFIFPDEPVLRMQLHLLELEYKLTTFRIVYASDLRRADSRLDSTIDRMVNMWLTTNFVDEVHYYKAKDFVRRRPGRSATVTPRDRKTRVSNGGYLQLLFPKPVKPLRQTLHIIREVDPIVDPGFQQDGLLNQRSEDRRALVQENLQRFTEKLHAEGHSYVLFLGSQDAQWWRTYLQHLGGEWWLHMPWSFTVHSRF